MITYKSVAMKQLLSSAPGAHDAGTSREDAMQAEVDALFLMMSSEPDGS